MSGEADVVVRHVPEESAYVIEVDGVRAGRAEYEIDGDRVIFTHTEIDDEFSGRGLGNRLARFALDDVKARGSRIVPRCPFIAAYVQRHEEYQDLVDEV